MQVEYKNIDPKLVVNEIRNGRSLEAVQKLYGIRMKSEVQDLYMKGLEELGEIPSMRFTASSDSSVPPAMMSPSIHRRPTGHLPPTVLIRSIATRTIGHSGSITLNKALLINDLGFTHGDAFEIYREEDRIVLKRVDNPL